MIAKDVDAAKWMSCFVIGDCCRILTLGQDMTMLSLGFDISDKNGDSKLLALYITSIVGKKLSNSSLFLIT